MKKILLFLLTATMLLSAFGCSESKPSNTDSGKTNQSENVNQPGNITQIFTPRSGRYYAEHTTDDPDELLKIPYIDLDMEKLTFNMGAGKDSSYVEHGNIAIVDGTMTLTGQDGIFVFEIHNEKNIMVSNNGNHPKIKINNYVVFTYDEFENK
ncbi:MAG: hypothetical protein E7384_04870 [Ruminococcaceae bacterium]|nr:hypothetical protein [Oscillospiraceae bacterium]